MSSIKQVTDAARKLVADVLEENHDASDIDYKSISRELTTIIILAVRAKDAIWHSDRPKQIPEQVRRLCTAIKNHAAEAHALTLNYCETCNIKYDENPKHHCGTCGRLV